MKKCKGCGYPERTASGAKIWMSDDGYCSVCYFKKHRKEMGLKKRTRNKRIWDYGE